MKGVAAGDQGISDIAALTCGYSDRGVGVQAVVLAPSRDDFDSACVYLTRREALVFWARLSGVIIESLFSRGRPVFSVPILTDSGGVVDPGAQLRGAAEKAAE